MTTSFPFSLVQLERFVAVAEELHFTRAAARLNVSQPLLSAQIRELEDSLGAKLFERSSRKVELTAAGALFRQRALSMLNVLRDSVAATQEVATGRKAPIRIGYTDEFSRQLLPELVGALKAEDPSAEIHLMLGAVPELTSGIADGTLDLALLCPLPAHLDPNWRLLPLPDAQLLVGLRKDHPLAAHGTLTIGQIADEPFVASTIENAGSELLADRLFAEHGLTRKIAQRAGDPHLMNSLAASGVGLLLATAADFAPYPTLAAIPLEPTVRLTRGAVSRISNEGLLLTRVRQLLSSPSSSTNSR